MAVTDLTRTKWVLNASVSQLSDTYIGSGYIEYLINTSTVTYNGIAHSLAGNANVEVAFYLQAASTRRGNLYGFYTSKAMTGYNAAIVSAGWYRRVRGTTASSLVLEKMTGPLTISIVGGTKTTDATLIAWLEANATQIVPQGKTIINGLPPIKKMFGTTEIVKEVLNGVTVYEKKASTISFTIQGTTYQAEEGMTWQQWVDSAYNTNNYYVQDNHIARSPIGIVGYLMCGPVAASEVIEGNRNYVEYNPSVCN